MKTETLDTSTLQDVLDSFFPIINKVMSLIGIALLVIGIIGYIYKRLLRNQETKAFITNNIIVKFISGGILICILSAILNITTHMNMYDSLKWQLPLEIIILLTFWLFICQRYDSKENNSEEANENENDDDV